jgi:hypothetical protein
MAEILAFFSLLEYCPQRDPQIVERNRILRSRKAGLLPVLWPARILRGAAMAAHNTDLRKFPDMNVLLPKAAVR